MERLQKIRALMRKNKIDLYLVFLSDDHGSEYVGDHFKETAYLSGFTGSNATLVIREEEAGLWTDGRYFVQAAGEITDSGFLLYKMGVEGVPSVTEYVKKHLKHGMRLGFDGRRISAAEYRRFAAIVEHANAKMDAAVNLVDEIWKDRPPLPANPVWILRKEFSGVSYAKKIADVREAMEKSRAGALFLTSLYDIAWLTNLRGNDIRHVPVFLSFMLITAKRATLYLQEGALTDEVRAYLKKNEIIVKPYQSAYKDIRKVSGRLMLDSNVVNAAIALSLKSSVKLVDGRNPTEFLKCKKNPTEIENTRVAHIRDGVAVTKFIYYIKTNVGKKELTECSAAAYLNERRKELLHYLDDSFETISAYGANAAMMHYVATKEHDAKLMPKGFLLVDSGGHYLEGTTDITRTICLGEVTEEERVAYTRVLRANLRLAGAHFMKGTCTQNLDILARGPMWDEGLDYRCGTGHGVGHVLNVHEGPNGFRTRVTDAYPLCELTPGMITTDEPGLYEEGRYGIRIENELLCVEDKKTPYGQFYRFDVLTAAPIDLDAVEGSMLTQYEKETLNAYHRWVYETLRPYLTNEESEWLKVETREL